MDLKTIQELRELEEKATPGEWEFEEYSQHIYDGQGYEMIRNEYGYGPHEGRLIVSLRNNAKALLDMAEECLRLREEVQKRECDHAYKHKTSMTLHGKLLYVYECEKCGETKVSSATPDDKPM